MAEAGEQQWIRVKITKGCPQGGVLSPLLWCIEVDDLLEGLNRLGYPAQAYADDLAVSIRGRNLSTVGEVMQAALRIVEVWCRDNGLSENANKTDLVLFTKKMKLGRLVRPKIFGKEVALSGSVKYLGVTLDSKMNWKEHWTTDAR